MGTNLKPPQWIDSLIENGAPHHLEEEIRGDLYELFLKDVERVGLRSARRKYVVNGVGFLFKSFFWKKSPGSNNSIMLGNYFKMARRSLATYKGTAIINTLGLVIGIASTLVILTVIHFELSFDSFHTNANRIYRIVRVSGSDMSEFRTGISFPLPEAIKDEVPSLENIFTVDYMGGAYIDVLDPSGSTVRKFREEAGCVLVEPAFFKVFDFKGTSFRWISGNPANALNEPFSVVLTRSMAKKYFGAEKALGQTLKFQHKHDCKVTGVIEDFPPNTDFPFTVLISYETLKVLAGKDQFNDWYSVDDSNNTYVVLAPGSTAAEMEAEIAKVHAAHTPEELHKFRHYLLQKLSDVHYDARFGTFSGRTISRNTLLGLGIIALFLLLTGSINYINLSTAQSTLRAKEIGLRKVMGSNRKNLMIQFFTETLLLVFISGIIALVLSEIILVNFQSLLNLKLTHYNFTDAFTLLSLTAIIIAVTCFSAMYPSLVIVRFNPIAAIQNRFATGATGGIGLRKVLVVVQFTITQMLVIGTFIVVSQMRYFQNVDMGFTREAIITSRIPDQDPAKIRTLEAQLRSRSFVSDVSFSYTLPSGVNRNRSSQDIGKPDAASMKDFVIFEFVSIDSSFLNLYGIRLLAGRNLNIQDTSGNILINKTLVKNLNLGSPLEAIGNELKIGGRKVTVVGVVDDYYSNSLKSEVDNIVMLVRPENYAIMSIKLNAANAHGSLTDAIQQIERLWTSTYPEFIFNYEFFDENIKAFYAQEQKYADLFQLFSLVFLLIGCLGLYGLITFVVNRKGKEVAIRKVLGATLSNVLLMFSKEYVSLILISFVIAVPVTYYVVDKWLSNFANHIELSGWFFVIPGLMVLVIALCVVTTKSLRAANANPVDRLKYE